MAGRGGDGGAGGKGVGGFIMESRAAVLLALMFVDVFVCLLAKKGEGLGADKGDDLEGVLRFKAEGSRRDPLRRNERGVAEAEEEPGVDEVGEALTAVPVLPGVLRAVRTEEAERGGVCDRPRAGLKGSLLFMVFSIGQRLWPHEKWMKKMDEWGKGQ